MSLPPSSRPRKSRSPSPRVARTGAADVPVDWGEVMRAVALALLGEPNWRLSSEWELRYGTRGSLSIDTREGRWFSHEEGRGGGVVDLVMWALECDRARALDWLRGDGHLPGSTPVASGHGPQAVRRPRAAVRPARPHSGDSPVRSARIVEPIVTASVRADGTPAHTYLHDRGAWPSYELAVPLSDDVRWLARECAPSPIRDAKWLGLPGWAAGALVIAMRSPLSGDLRSVGLEALDVLGCWPAAERWRRVFGPAKGVVFESRAGVDVLHVVEGVVDALSLRWAPWVEPGRVVALGGTSGLNGLRACDVQPLAGSATTVVLHPDGDRAGETAAVQAQAYVQATGRTCRIRRCPTGTDPAEEFAAWLVERAKTSKTTAHPCTSATHAAWTEVLQQEKTP